MADDPKPPPPAFQFDRQDEAFTAAPAPSPAAPPPAPAPVEPPPPVVAPPRAASRVPAPRGPLSGASRLVLALAGLGGLASAGVLYVLAYGAPWASRAPSAGSIAVHSTPVGAEILLDGRKTGKRTPGKLDDVPFGRPVKVEVALEGHLPIPRVHELSIPPDVRSAIAEFQLRPARVIEITSRPPGATVSVDGHAIGRTPTRLPPLADGESVDVELELAGHLSVRQRIVAREGAPREEVALDEARPMTVESHPSGADVFIDARRVGRTPLVDHQVPKGRAFALVLRRPGYRPFELEVRDQPRLDVELEGIPVDALGLPPAQAARARELERLVSGGRGERTRLAAELAKLKAELAKAEAKDDFEAEARLTRAIDKRSLALDELDAKAAEGEAELDELRRSVAPAE